MVLRGLPRRARHVRDVRRQSGSWPRSRQVQTRRLRQLFSSRVLAPTRGFERLLKDTQVSPLPYLTTTCAAPSYLICFACGSYQDWRPCKVGSQASSFHIGNAPVAGFQSSTVQDIPNLYPASSGDQFMPLWQGTSIGLKAMRVQGQWRSKQQQWADAFEFYLPLPLL